MRFATALIVVLATIDVAHAQAEAPRIIALWEAEKSAPVWDAKKSLPTHADDIAMVPIKVWVRFANPSVVAFKLGGKGIGAAAVTYLPAESPSPGVHTYRLASLRRGKYPLVAYSDKLTSPELFVTVKDPPKPVIEAVFESGRIPAKAGKKVEMRSLKTFLVVIEKYEEGDEWLPYVNSKEADKAVIIDKDDRIIRVMLKDKDIEDKNEFRFQLRLHRNGWGSELSDEIILHLPPPPPKPAPPPPKVVPPPSPEAPVSYPFWDAPQVFQVRKDGDCCKLPEYCSLKKCADDAKPKKILTWLPVRIAAPANFPQVRYGEAGECIETPGAIIYEGMQLVVADDGRYEITFNASTPRVPVTMRLTLMVCDPVAKKLVPLTLPAIALVPEYRSEPEGGAYAVSSNNYQENWHVRHLGYSPELRNLFSGARQPNNIQMSRTGVARFGSLPLSR